MRPARARPSLPVHRAGVLSVRPSTAALVALLVAGPLPAQNVERLTSTGARNGQAFVSPDGVWIAFVSNRSGAWQVWLMPSGGGPARRLTDEAGPAGGPTWTPDGSAIVYYARTADGYRMRRVEVATGEAETLRADGGDEFRPHLTADGERLLFDRSRPGVTAGHDLFVRTTATGRDTRLTDHPGYDSDARWSPDGRRIAFHSDRAGDAALATQVWVMNADGSEVRRLTDGPAIHGYPAWSPDGRYLAFTAERAGDRDVWIMTADGVARRRVTEHPGFDGDPAWSADGRFLVFTTDRFGGQELARVDVSSMLPDASR